MQAFNNENQPITELEPLSEVAQINSNRIEELLSLKNVAYVKITKILKVGGLETAKVFKKTIEIRRHQNR